MYVSAVAEGLSCRWCSASVLAITGLNFLCRGRLLRRISRLRFFHYPFSPLKFPRTAKPSLPSSSGQPQSPSSAFSALSTPDFFSSLGEAPRLSVAPASPSPSPSLLGGVLRRCVLRPRASVLFATLRHAIHKKRRQRDFLFSSPSAGDTSQQREKADGRWRCSRVQSVERGVEDPVSARQGVFSECREHHSLSTFPHASRRPSTLCRMFKHSHLRYLFRCRSGSMIRHAYGDLRLLHMQSSLMAGHPVECLYSLYDFLCVIRTTQSTRPEESDTHCHRSLLPKCRGQSSDGESEDSLLPAAVARPNSIFFREEEGVRTGDGEGKTPRLNAFWHRWILQAMFLGVQAVCEVQRVAIERTQRQREREEDLSVETRFFILDWKVGIERRE